MAARPGAARAREGAEREARLLQEVEALQERLERSLRALEQSEGRSERLREAMASQSSALRSTQRLLEEAQRRALGAEARAEAAEGALEREREEAQSVRTARGDADKFRRMALEQSGKVAELEAKVIASHGRIQALEAALVDEYH
jgi:hypothetical protein